MTLFDFFDKLRVWGNHRNRLLSRLKIYGLWNWTVAITANAVLPLWFRLTAGKRGNSLTAEKRAGRQVVVSMTSFPKRLPKLWLGVETILRQTVKPDRFILYLTASQVPDGVESLPKSLLKLRDRGLEIQLVPDQIRSHTKYFYAMQQFPDDTVITVDDDLFYRSDLIEALLNNADNHPGCVVANWTKSIIKGRLNYNEWPDTDTPGESKNRLILGVSSVLYPPGVLHKDAYNVEAIQTLTLTADDVWITAMLLKQGTPVYKTEYSYNYLPILIRNNETLISGNYVRNQKCVDAINAYYERKGEARPFIDLIGIESEDKDTEH